MTSKHPPARTPARPRLGFTRLALLWLLACGAGGSWLLLGGEAAVEKLAGFTQTPPAPVTASPAATAKKIEDIKAGEIVWACDPVTGEWSHARVIRPTAAAYHGDVVTVRVAGEAIEATGNHPFWVAEGERISGRPAAGEDVAPEEEAAAAASGRGRWVQARHLMAGDTLLLRSGQKARLEGVSSRQARLQVYNLVVDGPHTYAVSAAGVLVHNTRDCDLVPITAKGKPIQPEAEVDLYHGAPNGVEGGAFDLAKVERNRRAAHKTSKDPAVFLTDDPGRAIQQYATPKGQVAKATVPKRVADQMRQLDSEGRVEYKATTQDQIDALNRKLQIKNVKDAMLDWWRSSKKKS